MLAICGAKQGLSLGYEKKFSETIFFSERNFFENFKKFFRLIGIIKVFLGMSLLYALMKFV